jgi:hypothetical protein
VSAALVKLDAGDGWQVYRDEGAGFWMLDLDIAYRAGLAKPRDIRATIRRAVEGCALQVWRRDDGANEGDQRRDDGADPTVREVIGEAVSGKGRRQTVTEYWLNPAAVVLILGRLRTPAAERAIVGVTRGALRAFDAVQRPAALPPPPPLEPLALQGPVGEEFIVLVRRERERARRWARFAAWLRHGVRKVIRDAERAKAQDELEEARHDFATTPYYGREGPYEDGAEWRKLAEKALVFVEAEVFSDEGEKILGGTTRNPNPHKEARDEVPSREGAAPCWTSD